MELSETWKKLEKERLEKPMPDVILASKSRHPLAKLKRNYLLKTGFSIVFLFCFFACIFIFQNWIIQTLLVIVVFFYVGFLLTSLSIYRKLKEDLPVDGTLLHMLIQSKEMIEANLKFEQRMGLAAYPFACAVGFLMGFSTSGSEVSRVFSDRTLTIIFGVTIVVITALGFVFARWLAHKGYRRPLDEVQKLIDELKSE